jgi:hypothetical protein
MKKEQILEIIRKEGLFRYNIFNDHPQKANEVIIRQENGQYTIFRTDEKNKVLGDEAAFFNEDEAINYFIKQLHILKETYLSTYIGNNYIEYFKPKYKNRPLNKLFFSWIWPPFFIGYGWLMYRKMYFETLVVFCVFIISSIIEIIINTNIEIVRNVHGIMVITICLFGNSLYYLKINRVINKLENINGEEHIEYLKKHGRTNIFPVIIVEIVLVVIYFLPFIILKLSEAQK